MPPLYQDPLSAVPGAWRFLDLVRALVEVPCEGWALALVALAVFSYLESEVKGVLKAFLPLGLALVTAGAAALLARKLGGVPRPLDGAGHAVAPLLRRAFPSGQTAAVMVFVTYTALVYGRRAIPVVVPAALLGLAHALGGPHWAADLAGGGTLGLALGAVACGLTLRVAPDGHVAALRARRGGRRGASPAPAGPGSP
jgi:membrane-associated phospholipid phosphatase